MVRISQEESFAIRKRIPQACIAITNRQKSCKHYYVEESPDVMRFLYRLRNPRRSNDKRSGVRKNG